MTTCCNLDLLQKKKFSEDISTIMQKSNDPYSDAEKRLYQPLPASVDVKSASAKKLTDTNSCKDYVRDLVSGLLPSTNEGQHNFDKKLKNKTLLLTTALSSAATKSKAQERQRMRLGLQQKKMSAREKKQLQIFRVPRCAISYAAFERLHQLWLKYMEDILGDDCRRGSKGLGEKLLKADLHGCQLEVSRSSSPQYVGQCGLVMQETQETFKLVTRENRMIVIPKRGNVFVFQLFGKNITIYGNQFCYRASERVVRKFKVTGSLEL